VKGLVRPGTHRLVGASLLAAGLTLAVTFGIHATGYTRVLSPGPLASHHAGVEQDCAACHDSSMSREQLKCERCHDPAGEWRLTHSAHVLLGTNDRRLAAGSPELSCGSCHREHMGRTAVVRTVNDGECAACHTNVASFQSHPEFAVVKAARTPSVGIRFPHQSHLAEVLKIQGRSCEACHEPAADRVTFQPILFERHCISCHKNGLAEGPPTLDPTMVLTPAQVQAAGFVTSVTLTEAPQDRVKALAASHRDAWVQINALRLRAVIDADGDQLERDALAAALAYDEGRRRVRPLAMAADADLQAAIASLTQDIERLEARRDQAGAAVNTNTGALLEQFDAIVGQFKGLSPELDAVLAATPRPQQAPPAPTGQPGAEVNARRRAELERVITALAARAQAGGDAALQSRVADMQSRLAALSRPAGPDATPVDVAAGRLVALEDVVRSLLAVPGPAGNNEAQSLAFAIRAARQEILGGMTVESFEAARRGLLDVLDAIAASGQAAVAPRVALLRQRVAALMPGMTDPAEIAFQIEDRRRQLERLRLEVELRAEPWSKALPAVSLAGPPARANYAQTPEVLSRMLAFTAQAPLRPVPIDEAITTLNRLVGVVSPKGVFCAKCHDFGADGARLAAVRIAEPVHARATFTHAPHLTVATCASCHNGIATSTEASDPNVPGVATCQGCHKPAAAPATCATCHRYHTRSMAGGVR
jgi:hypothetical protein